MTATYIKDGNDPAQNIPFGIFNLQPPFVITVLPTLMADIGEYLIELTISDG